MLALLNRVIEHFHINKRLLTALQMANPGLFLDFSAIGAL